MPMFDRGERNLRLVWLVYEQLQHLIYSFSLSIVLLKVVGKVWFGKIS